ncbi:MAG: metallophosphoesterase [Clostridia bacterium]|nr:metallophosphoesterase [Clostridia bacterium]
MTGGRRPGLDVSRYEVSAPADRDLTAVCLSDVHGEEFDYILEKTAGFSPDVIFIPGDITHRHEKMVGRGADFLAACASLCPTFMSFGNHENLDEDAVRRECDRSGVRLLDNSSADFHGLTVGGLTSGYLGIKKERQGHFTKTPPPDLDWLASFDRQPGYKILLSHHPEYYPRYIKDTGIDLILSGHAHGGQWRLFGRPFFAPDQAFFPKYAQGFTDGRLIVSRGLANNAPAPRFFNRREIVIIDIRKSEG